MSFKPRGIRLRKKTSRPSQKGLMELHVPHNSLQAAETHKTEEHSGKKALLWAPSLEFWSIVPSGLRRLGWELGTDDKGHLDCSQLLASSKLQQPLTNSVLFVDISGNEPAETSGRQSDPLHWASFSQLPQGGIWIQVLLRSHRSTQIVLEVRRLGF